jgi:hypothetical protein
LTKVSEKLNKHKAFKIVGKAWNELFEKKTYRKEHECMNCKQSKCIENNYKKKVLEKNTKKNFIEEDNNKSSNTKHWGIP